MIRLTNVSKNYGNKALLKDVNIEFLDSHTYFLSGESGIGKTTLLNIIAGYTSYEGNVWFSNSNSIIGYMFQEPLLFSNMTVEDNLVLKCIAIKKSLSDTAIEHAVSTVLNMLRISTLRKKKVSTLSGGEKQRLQIAMLIFNNPDIILMDEPTANLDAGNKRLIYQSIESLFPNALKIVVSHDDFIADGAINLTIRKGHLEYV